MAVDDATSRERCQEIAVHDEHTIRIEAHFGKRPSCPQGFSLAPVNKLDPETPAVAKVRLDQLGEMADCEVRTGKSSRNELAEQDLEDRHIPDRHKWFGKNCRVRA